MTTEESKIRKHIALEYFVRILQCWCQEHQQYLSHVMDLMSEIKLSHNLSAIYSAGLLSSKNPFSAHP